MSSSLQRMSVLIAVNVMRRWSIQAEVAASHTSKIAPSAAGRMSFESPSPWTGNPISGRNSRDNACRHSTHQFTPIEDPFARAVSHRVIEDTPPRSHFRLIASADRLSSYNTMKKRYYLQPLSVEERLYHEFVLASEVDQQRWYIVMYLDLWNYESLICIQ